MPAPDINMLADFLGRLVWLTGEREGSLPPPSLLPMAGKLLGSRGGAGGGREAPTPAPSFCCCIFMSCMTYIQTGSY